MSAPTANYRIQGTGHVEFGADGVAFTTCGVLVSGGNKVTGDKLELKDAQGNVFCTIYFNDKNECTIEIIFDTTASANVPIRGDAISAMGLTNILVDDVEHKWQSGKERGLSIKGTRYAHLALS